MKATLERRLNTDCVVRRPHMLKESAYETGLERRDGCATVLDDEVVRGRRVKCRVGRGEELGRLWRRRTGAGK
jgi:hypothetical protein